MLTDLVLHRGTGTLPDGVTVDLLKIEHSYRPRNKTIARLLFLIGTLSWSHYRLPSSGTSKHRQPNFSKRRCIRYKEIPHATSTAIAEPLNMGFLLIAHY